MWRLKGQRTKGTIKTTRPNAVESDGDHSRDDVKFRDIFLTVHSTPAHVNCYTYHACTGVTVSGGHRNATVHDLKPK